MLPLAVEYPVPVRDELRARTYPESVSLTRWASGPRACSHFEQLAQTRALFLVDDEHEHEYEGGITTLAPLESGGRSPSCASGEPL